jgi:hypothetical protein
MSQPTVDARAVVRALDALTTHVKRIAEALADGSRQDSYALAPPVVDTDDAPTTTPDDGPRCVCGDPIELQDPRDPDSWIHSPGSDTTCLDAHLVRPGLPYRRTPAAADEDGQRTTRRDTLGHLLGRAERGALVSTGEGALLRQLVETEMREADRLSDDKTMNTAALEQLRTVLAYEHKRANDAINREETAEQAVEAAERDLRTLRAGLRANGADPTQLQNLWAQISLRNRQWRDTKRELAEAQAAIERVREVTARRLADDECSKWERHGYHSALSDVRRALDDTEHPEEQRPDENARLIAEYQAAILRVLALRQPIAEALEQADYRMDMRRGDLADAIMPVIRRAIDGTEQPTTEDDLRKPATTDPQPDVGSAHDHH